jgi:hypothetical protein
MRTPIRKTYLSLDTVAHIKRLFPRLQDFWRQHVDRQDMSMPTFYSIMRGEPGSDEHLEVIERAFSDCLASDVTLAPDSRAVADLRRCVTPWWLRASQDDWDKEAGHATRVATSAQFDTIRAELIRLGILDAHGYPIKRQEVPR